MLYVFFFSLVGKKKEKGEGKKKYLDFSYPLLNSPLLNAAGWLCHACGRCACCDGGGTARSTGWLWDLVGAVLPFNAVCKAVANADVSEVTVNRDVPEDVDIGSFVGGLLRMENETKKGGGGRLIDFSVDRSVGRSISGRYE